MLLLTHILFKTTARKHRVSLLKRILFINQNPGYCMKHNVPDCVIEHRSLTAIACMALLAISIASACKKDNENGITLKLMNKWSLVQITDTTYIPNTAPVISKYDGKADDYMDFRKDGKVYSSILSALDTAQYTYSEAKLIVNIDDFQYNILYLTNNSLVLWDPHFGTSTTTYIAHKITLKR
jgi:hypothetical protein